LPVQGSVQLPQTPTGHSIAGVQQLSFTPHTSPLEHVVLVHVTAEPVHGSVHVEPHQPMGHSTAGVQHVLEAEQVCEPQLPEQLTVVFVHGSTKEPQKPAGHDDWEQQRLASPPPVAPHCSPVGHVVEHVNVVPLHGSVHDAPQ
jgi:hypothetical protein